MDKKQLQDLKKLMTLCKQEGIKSIELDGLKMEFNPFAKVEEKQKRSMIGERCNYEKEYLSIDVIYNKKYCRIN